jgi:hypothetical protein
MKKKILLLTFFTVSFSYCLLAQSAIAESTPTLKGFRGIELGMDMDKVKELLLNDAYFNYRGDPDIYILPLKEQTLIECEGNSYVKRAYFQFHEKKLFIMIISLNQSRLDYFTLLSTLTEKYGQPQSFSPSKAVWSVNNIQLSLERPLTVKYIESTVFSELKEQGQAEEKAQDISRKDFLEEF